MKGSISILDPRAERSESIRLLPALDDLRGKSAAILSNGWTSMDRLAEHFGKLLRERYGVAQVIHVPIPISSAMDTALLDTTCKEADFAILGLAN